MKRTLFVLLLSSGSGAIALEPLLPNSIALATGRSHRLPVAAGQDVRLANGRILKIEDRGNAIVITGKKTGSTELLIGSKSYRVHVATPHAVDAFTKLRNLTLETKGLTADWSDSVPVLTGELLRFEDWLAAAEAAGNAPYFFRASVSGETARDALEHFNGLIAKNRLPAPLLKFEDEARLSLPPGQNGLKKTFERVFGPFGFKIDIDEKLVALEPMVEVSIIVAEVRRKSFSRLGIQWPASYSAKILPKPEFNGAAEIALQSLEEKGLGKILASPKLLCRSGKEAQFLAGGEFPIKIMNYKVNDVVWKKHGVLLQIRPLVDFEGHMSIALQTEVSMIDTSQVVDGIPGLLTNRIESHFDLERSETIALSGLIKKEWGKSRTGLPGLASLPVLGLLFSSEDYRENRTELVVFVTPRVVPVKGVNQSIDMPEEWNATK
ncbi:MAG: pilus assembly protein [Bdellovibrionia bacterium]